LQKDEYVGVLSEVDGERRKWKWMWRRNLFQWEVERLELLETFLENVRLSNDIDDWRWIMNSEEGFSVKSAYDLLVEFGDSPNFGPYERMILSKIWESSAPSKIVVFSWQLFHNRLPTKDNLFRRGVLDHKVGGNCVWCDSSPRSAKHLFAHCWFGHRVWYEIFKWFGVLMVMPHNLMSLLDCFCASVYNKRSKRGFLLV
jgi:hypothetical protein